MMSRLRLCVCVCVCVYVCVCKCVCVCVSGVGVQTSGPIATKLGMSVEGHLAGDLG